MIFICTQTTIAVLQNHSSGNILQPVSFLLSEEEWGNLFEKLKKRQLIRILPNKG